MPEILSSILIGFIAFFVTIYYGCGPGAPAARS